MYKGYCVCVCGFSKFKYFCIIEFGFIFCLVIRLMSLVWYELRGIGMRYFGFFIVCVKYI